MSSDPRGKLSSGGHDFAKIKKDTYPFIDPKKLDMSGMHVMVTGASKGLGQAMCLSFAAAGASVIVGAARSNMSQLEEKIAQAASSAGRQAPKVVTLTMDVTKSESVEAAAETAKKEVGHLDVVVNNAGYMESWAKMTEANPQEWWTTFNVNVFGLFLVMRSFIPLILASSRPEKTLINVTSAGGLHAFPAASGYQTTKLAAIRLSEFAQAEYGEEGLVAYSLHPGGVPTDMGQKMPKHLQHLMSDTAELSGDTTAFLTSEKRDWLGGRYVSAQWDLEEVFGKKDQIIAGDLLKVRMAVE